MRSHWSSVVRLFRWAERKTVMSTSQQLAKNYSRRLQPQPKLHGHRWSSWSGDASSALPLTSLTKILAVVWIRRKTLVGDASKGMTGWYQLRDERWYNMTGARSTDTVDTTKGRGTARCGFCNVCPHHRHNKNDTISRNRGLSSTGALLIEPTAIGAWSCVDDALMSAWVGLFWWN